MVLPSSFVTSGLGWRQQVDEWRIPLLLLLLNPLCSTCLVLSFFLAICSCCGYSLLYFVVPLVLFLLSVCLITFSFFLCDRIGTPVCKLPMFSFQSVCSRSHPSSLLVLSFLSVCLRFHPFSLPVSFLQGPGVACRC